MLIVLSLNVIVFIAIAVALFWKYRLTRDAGFLWFSAAIVVWPLVSAGVVFRMARLSSESVPFSLSPGEFVAGGLYILELIERILFFGRDHLPVQGPSPRREGRGLITTGPGHACP